MSNVGAPQQFNINVGTKFKFRTVIHICTLWISVFKFGTHNLMNHESYTYESYTLGDSPRNLSPIASKMTAQD